MELAFAHMLSDPHERHLDELRSQVQQFFDTLSPRQKEFLGPGSPARPPITPALL